MFDYRYKDLETGKLNIDKLTTVNSCHSYSDLVGSGTECTVEYYEYRRNAYEQRIIHEQEREKYELERIVAQKERELRRIAELEETRKNLRDIQEYRDRLNAHEAEMARMKKKTEEEQGLIYLGGADHGRYIITSKGKVRQG